jgi:hypothetical protein
MKDFSNFKNSQGVAKFFGDLMAARQQAHILHLASRSFAEHKALGSFYDSLTDLTDTLVETYQGQYGLVEIDSKPMTGKAALPFLESLASHFLDSHKLFSQKDTHLHNILDEIVSLTFQTHYKVKFLK